MRSWSKEKKNKRSQKWMSKQRRRRRVRQLLREGGLPFLELVEGPGHHHYPHHIQQSELPEHDLALQQKKQRAGAEAIHIKVAVERGLFLETAVVQEVALSEEVRERGQQRQVSVR